MLKTIFFCGLMTVIFNDWLAVQVLLFMGSLMMGLYSCNLFYSMNVGFSLGLDYISYVLIFLSIWITSLVLCGSQKVKDTNNYSGVFILLNLLLLLSLILTFSCKDYLMFYICFESSLIPILILILGWGYQPERMQAGVYMLFYTLFASLPLLVSLLCLYYEKGSLMIDVVGKVEGAYMVSLIWYFCTIFAFVVKLPMFMVHLWLPKAHVEAPVAGSMILAGVLLKLGGYGLVRTLPLFLSVNLSISWVWVSFGALGGLMVSFICLRQSDMKSLIAYSSVAHMGLVLCGLIVASSWGLSGAIAVMIGHGLCSSGLFCIANMAYERIGSRSLMISKGLLNIMPSLALWWFLLTAGNMAAPPTLNLLGEISLILSVVSWSEVSMISIGLLSFFSAAYSLYMYSLSQHGKFFSSLFSCCSGKVREYLVLTLHWLPLNIAIMNGGLLVY